MTQPELRRGGMRRIACMPDGARVTPPGKRVPPLAGRAGFPGLRAMGVPVERRAGLSIKSSSLTNNILRFIYRGRPERSTAKPGTNGHGAHHAESLLIGRQ